MNENEAIIRFDFIRCALLGGTKPHIMPNEENIRLVDAAIKALEEVQQYHAIGTPEECLRNKDFLDKLAAYEDAEEQGKLRLPCEVGDAVYLIDKGENDRLQVYEGKWRRVSLVQTSKSSSFELCGEISYDKHDCFYNDGRTMEQGMYVGQESTKIGEVVFLTREQAEAKLKELEGEQWKD